MPEPFYLYLPKLNQLKKSLPVNDRSLFIVLAATLFFAFPVTALLAQSNGSTEIVALPGPVQLPARIPAGFTWLHDIRPDSSFFESFGNRYAEDTLSIFCFRGNERRSAPSRGTVKGRPKGIIADWNFQTAYDNTNTALGTWGGGAGWTGQPLILKWTSEQKKSLGIADPVFAQREDALEVIIGSLCGNIYFLDAERGVPTRPHLSIGNPIKGTVSVDPRKNGLLYVGQGIKAGSRFGGYVFNMFTRRELVHIPGLDPFAARNWGAFDSNPLVDAASGTVFWPAENGLIYRFRSGPEGITDLTRLKYQHPKMFRQGLEASMSVWRNLGFFSDNSGTVLCIDLRTMKPVWQADNFDDSDASLLFESVGDLAWIYTGHEIDKLAPQAVSRFRKLDARTGKELWNIGRSCYGTNLNGKTNSGGILCSPVLGKRKGEGLVYTLFSRVNAKNQGELVAVDKHTGKEVFSYLLDNYSWASPVDFYDQAGNIYLFFTDVYGTVYILDGRTGQQLVKTKTGNVFEASPVIINDRVIVAARGRSILSYCIQTGE